MCKKLFGILAALAVAGGALSAAALSPTPADVGRVATDAEAEEHSSIPYPWEDSTRDAVSRKFIAEYEYQQSKGVNVGKPCTDFPAPHYDYYGLVHQWGAPAVEGEEGHPEYSFVVQNFYQSDSSKTVSGLPKAAIIMMDSPDSPAFTVMGPIYFFYDACGSVNTAGSATSNSFEFKGDTYQRFTNFFVKVPKGKTNGVAYHFEQAEEDGLVIPKEALGVGYTGGDVKYGGNTEPPPTQTPPTQTQPTDPNPGSEPEDTTGPDDSSATEATGDGSTQPADETTGTNGKSTTTTAKAASVSTSGEGGNDAKGGGALPWIIAIVVVVLLAGGGGAAYYFLVYKKKHAE